MMKNTYQNGKLDCRDNISRTFQVLLTVNLVYLKPGSDDGSFRAELTLICPSR